MNTYIYVISNPINFTDETGLFVRPPIEPIVGIRIGFELPEGIVSQGGGLDPIPWYMKPPSQFPSEFYMPREHNPWDRAGYKNAKGDILACSIDNKDRCLKLLMEMYETIYTKKDANNGMRGLQERYLTQRRDPGNLFINDPRGWQTHNDQIESMVNRLKNLVNEAKKLGCYIPEEILHWTYIKPPTRPWYY